MLLILIIYYIVKNSSNANDAKLNNEIIINGDNLEEYLIEADLNVLLEEAVSNENYKLAIRIYFLMIIKDLNSSKRIIWQMDKTNRDYLTEMSIFDDYLMFRKVTHLFEYVWYSDFLIDHVQFGNLKPIFIEYLYRLNKVSDMESNKL